MKSDTEEYIKTRDVSLHRIEFPTLMCSLYAPGYHPVVLLCAEDNKTAWLMASELFTEAIFDERQ